MRCICASILLTLFTLLGAPVPGYSAQGEEQPKTLSNRQQATLDLGMGRQLGLADPGVWLEGKLDWPAGFAEQEDVDLSAQIRRELGHERIRYMAFSFQNDGSFRIKIPEGKLQGELNLEGANLVFEVTPGFTIYGDEVRWHGAFTPEVAGKLRVKVVGEDGKSIRGTDFYYSNSPNRPARKFRVGKGALSFLPSLAEQELLNPIEGLLPGRQAWLVVTKEGYADSAFPVPKDLIRPGRTAKLEVVLKPEVPLTIRLIGPGGHPLTGFAVDLLEGEGQSPFYIGNSDVGPVKISLTPNEYSFKGLGPGRYVAQIRDLNSYLSKPKPIFHSFEIEEGSADPVTIEVSPAFGYGAYGQVIDQNGTPIRNASIEVRAYIRREHPKTMEPDSERIPIVFGAQPEKIEADSMGRFRMSGYPEALHFELVATGVLPKKPGVLTRLVSRRFSAVVSDIDPNHQFTQIRVSQDMPGITGQVVDDRNQPIERYTLLARPATDAAMKRRQRHMPHLREIALCTPSRLRVSDENGRFDFKRLNPDYS